MVGVALIALPALVGWQHVTLVSPLFVFLLLTRVSGIPSWRLGLRSGGATTLGIGPTWNERPCCCRAGRGEGERAIRGGAAPSPEHHGPRGRGRGGNSAVPASCRPAGDRRLIRGARRLPLARLTSFGLCWLWLETIGVAIATAMWLTGRTGDAEAHYRLQCWWADRMLTALRVTCGVTIHVDGVSELHPAPVVVLVRHASLADSLLAVWAVTKQAQLNPRVVLKKELPRRPLSRCGGQPAAQLLPRPGGRGRPSGSG